MAMSVTSPRRALGRTVVVLGVVSLLTDIASDMAVPFLPGLLAGMGAGAAALGLIEGVATATSSLMKFFVGTLSDHMPRKKPLVLLGYTVSNLARPLLALAGAPWQVLTVRFVDRLGKGVRTSPRDALIARSAPKELHATAFGFHRAMDNLGAVFGPLVATAILRYYPDNIRLVLAATLIPGTLSVLWVAFGVREESVEITEEKSRTRLTLHGPVPAPMRPLLWMVALFTLANASDSFLLLRARELGVPLAWLPIVWGALSLVRALAATPGGWIADRIGRARALSLGWALYAVAYLGFGFARTPSIAALSLVIYGLYYGLTEGTERAMVTSLVPDSELGRAFGYFNLVTGLLALPSSVLFGWVLPYHHGAWAYGGAALLALASAAAMARWSRQLQSVRQFSRPDR